MFITTHLTRRQRDARIGIAKGRQVQSQMFHTWAKARKLGQVFIVAAGLAGPAFHGCPLSRVRAFGSGECQPVTARSLCAGLTPRVKQTPVCGGALFCFRVSLRSLTFLEFSLGPWKPSLAPCLPGWCGVHCSSGRGLPARASQDNSSLQVFL